MTSAEHGPRVLVVGDVMVDQYVSGDVDRISPEAPVPVIRVVDRFDGLGGAGNVARQVAALGGTAALLAVVGDDAAGERARVSCAEHHIDAAGLIVADDRPTTTKLRIVVGRQQVARVDEESVAPIDDATERLLLSELQRTGRPDIVILSDYAKGVLTEVVIAAVLAAAASWRVPVLADPKHRDFGRYRGATLVKANLTEFEAAAGCRAGRNPEATVRELGEGVRSAAAVEHLIVTMGADGMVVFQPDDPPVAIASATREVYDVSGAGDTVIATLAIELARGASLLDGAAVANVAAGLAVQRRGVSVVTADDLAAAIHRAGHAPAKLHTRDDLMVLVGRWRAEGRRVVFTNGCFDLFHAGHVHLLGEAAALGDALVVAVDSDDSVRRLKGPERPIIGQTDRMAIIGALSCVDAVVSFDSGSLRSLIEGIAPDVLVKGADYAADEVVGGDVVTAAGGTVALIPLVGQMSTSAVVDKIRDA